MADRTRCSDERGANLVEFVIVLPILLLLVFGIIEFGINFDRKIATTNAAREGARAAVVGVYPGACASGTSSDKAMCTAIERLGLDASKTKAEVVVPGTAAAGQAVIVCVEYPVESITGIFSALLSGNELKGRAEMRIETASGLANDNTDGDLGWCSA
jgi:hypothetical protein